MACTAVLYNVITPTVFFFAVHRRPSRRIAVTKARVKCKILSFRAGNESVSFLPVVQYRYLPVDERSTRD